MSGADSDRERGGISRRKVLLGGGMLATGYLAWRWVRRGPEDVVVAILERQVGHLDVDRSSFTVFAGDYLESRREYERKLRVLSVGADVLRYFSPYRWLGMHHPLRRLEDTTVGLYLLSTDFFQNGADEERPIRYLGFYDPYRALCRNGLSRRVDIG